MRSWDFCKNGRRSTEVTEVTTELYGYPWRIDIEFKRSEADQTPIQNVDLSNSLLHPRTDNILRT